MRCVGFKVLGFKVSRFEGLGYNMSLSNGELRLFGLRR